MLGGLAILSNIRTSAGRLMVVNNELIWLREISGFFEVLVTLWVELIVFF